MCMASKNAAIIEAMSQFEVYIYVIDHTRL